MKRPIICNIFWKRRSFEDIKYDTVRGWCRWYEGDIGGMWGLRGDILIHFTKFYNILQRFWHFITFYDILKHFTIFYNFLRHLLQVYILQHSTPDQRCYLHFWCRFCVFVNMLLFFWHAFVFLCFCQHALFFWHAFVQRTTISVGQTSGERNEPQKDISFLPERTFIIFFLILIWKKNLYNFFLLKF